MLDLQARVDSFIGRQQRCPSGLVGRIIGERMARQHAPETLWTITLLDLAPTDRVLDMGCGAGRAIALVAAQTPHGHVSGIDLSGAMVRASSRRNARAIAAGRVDVQQGDVAALPFAGLSFDKVMSIHSVYFWTDPERAIAEIERVLKPGGRLALTLSPGTVGAADDARCRAMVEECILPSLRRSGFTTAAVAQGPDSRQYRTIAVTGVK